jgi:hypothetical protein
MRGSVLPAVLSLAIIDSINPASITGALISPDPDGSGG